MIIKDGVLVQVSVEDINTDGYILIPSEVKMVEEEAFSNLSTLKTVEFSGDVELSSYAFSNLPNLASIKFGGKTRFNSACINEMDVPNLKDVQISPITPLTRFCFGKDLTKQILVSRIEIIEKILENPNATNKEIKYAMEIYDNIIFHQAYYQNFDKEFAQRINNVSFQVITKLRNKDSNGRELGENFIRDKLTNNELITPSLLNYDTFKLYQSLNLDEYFMPINFALSMKGAAMGEDNVLTFDINSMKRLYSKKTGEQSNSNIDTTLFMMWVIRHETMHLYHKTRNPNSNNIDDKKMYLMSKLQRIEDGYETGYSSRHIAKHDCFPDEIDADTKAIMLLAENVMSQYGFDSYKKDDYISKYNQRLQRAYEEIGISTEEDIMQSVIEKALSSANLSDSEREELHKFYQDYIKLCSGDEKSSQ